MAKGAAKARSSQLVTTYGVGALFPSMDESFMVCGLDEWRAERATEVPEPRLARSLGVETFRSPPTGSSKGRDVPVVRFPEMHYCPDCRRLAPLWKFCRYDENECKACSRDLTPSRFVACCARGHIEDFPYFAWVHRDQGQAGAGGHELSLHTRGRSSSLEDIEIRCTCGVRAVSMGSSFGRGALKGIARCHGNRPWLPDAEPQACEEELRTLQRGSSNVWFAMVRSALSIPPWSEGVHRLLDKHWPVFAAVPAEALAATITAIPSLRGVPVADLVQAVLERREGGGSAPTEQDLRQEEYKALVQGRPETAPDQQFVCVPVDIESGTRRYVEQVSEVSRLREVRALEGFTRVTPPMAGMPPVRRGALTAGRAFWLPAIEVLGEGVFVRMDEQRLRTWESSDFARSRAEAIQRMEDERARLFGLTSGEQVTARGVLLHSFAHVLLNELSLDAGYPAASLRERLFAGQDQSGLLIYTASADSAGSLGGLSAQSRPDRIAAVLRSAVLRSAWCSSDPVCIESTSSGADALNLAACHACLLLPETSCEQQNNYLDRATLVGTPDSPDAGFFAELLAGR